MSIVLFWDITQRIVTSNKEELSSQVTYIHSYNKMNGVWGRHFGKEMNKETKFRLHNVTDKATGKFSSETWNLKIGDEQKLEVAKMKILRHLLVITKLDRERNQSVRKKTGCAEH